MPHPAITARTYPHKPAIIMGDSGELVSYRQLDERSNRAARLFRSLGLVRGDHIALMLENRREFLELCWGAQRAGLIYTAVSSHLRAGETAYILNNCDAQLFIASALVAEVAVEAAAAAPGLRACLMMDGIRGTFEAFEEALDRQPPTPIDDEANGVAMLYSSGTTGQPKGVFVPPASDDVHAPHFLAPTLGAAFGFGEETIYLSPAPLYHAAPLHFSMLTHYVGGTVVVMEHFDPEKSLSLIQEHGVTHSQWVPIMFVRMLKLPEERRLRYDLGSMQVAIHAAAPCPVEVKEKMIDWWGEIVYEYYSASEAAGATMVGSREWLSHKGTVGRQLLGELHIVDEEGRELPPNEIGTVYFSGPQVTFAYHREPEKTADSYDERGWATIGDLGYVDEEGFLYLTDRKHFTIISGGVNIYPQEIENVLINHDKVADVAVFGVPHPEYGEAVQAVVEPLNWGDATDEVALELLEWLRERVSHIKLPRGLDFREKLPRLDNGKLYKRHLVEEYRAAVRDERPS